MPFLPDEREYRAMPVELVEDASGSDNSNSMKVRGYCTTYNEKYLLHSGPDFEVWEQVAPGFFDEADETDVIMQYDHQGHVYARGRQHRGLRAALRDGDLLLLYGGAGNRDLLSRALCRSSLAEGRLFCALPQPQKARDGIKLDRVNAHG